MSDEQLRQENQKIIERESSHLRSRYELMYTDKQIELLDSALSYAIKMHGQQCRVSGEPYITHQIAVANILFDIGWIIYTTAAA